MHTLEKILHSKKLAYRYLEPLMEQYVSRNKLTPFSTEVNIYIDVAEVFKSLYNPKVMNLLDSLKSKERFIIASEIVNLVSHYRHFFYSRMNMYSTFYFYYSDEQSEYHTNIDSDYKREYYSKRLQSGDSYNKIFDRIVYDNVKLINSFLQYVPHAYFINTKQLEPNALPYYMISKCENKDTMHMILSNDKVQYQNLTITDKVIQLENRGENSVIITSENMYEYILKDSKTKTEFSMFPELFPVLVSMVNQKAYDMKGIKNLGYVRGMTFIDQCIDNGSLKNIEYLDIEELENSLRDELKPDQLEKFINNFKMFNHHIVVSENHYDIIVEKQIIDRIDALSVRKINEKYFELAPVLIDYCYEGEEYE